MLIASRQAAHAEITSLDSADAQALRAALIAVVLDAAPRLPEDRRFRNIAGIAVPVIALGPSEPAAPIKIEYALKALAKCFESLLLN